MGRSEMDKVDKIKGASRRKFLQGIAAIPAVALAGGKSFGADAIRLAEPARAYPRAPFASDGKRFVALQIGARSFVDEGVDECLDTLQEKGGVNVLMPTVFTYGRGLSGRQVPGQPLPDHGVQEYDQIHGGSYTKVHPEFYANSVVKDIRAPELGDFDILADVAPAAKKRGMQVYALFEEAYNPKLITNFERIAEVDIYGRVGRDTCFNNPDARHFLTAMVEDWVKSNEL